MTTDSDEFKRRLASVDESDVYSALIAVGKAGETEHETLVAGFLDHANPQLRSAAIRVLGFYWRVPVYRERAAAMAKSEPDPAARSVALMAWCAYYAGTHDAAVLRELYATFSDTSLSTVIRRSAYLGMMDVAGIAGPNQAHALPVGPLDESIDWDLVRTMLEGTGVEPPTHQTSVVATLGVRKVTYDYGEPHRPGNDIGRIVLTFNGETGIVELVQERRTALRGWRADLPGETWSNLVETLHRYEFPKPATVLEPPVPGSVSTTISWRRRGVTESVRITGRSLDYADVNRIAWNVVAQMAPALLDATPPPFPNTRVDRPYELAHVDK